MRNKTIEGSKGKCCWCANSQLQWESQPMLQWTHLLSKCVLVSMRYYEGTLSSCFNRSCTCKATIISQVTTVTSVQMGDNTASDGVVSEDITNGLPLDRQPWKIDDKEGNKELIQSSVPERNELQGAIKDDTPVALWTKRRWELVAVKENSDKIQIGTKRKNWLDNRLRRRRNNNTW